MGGVAGPTAAAGTSVTDTSAARTDANRSPGGNGTASSARNDACAKVGHPPNNPAATSSDAGRATNCHANPSAPASSLSPAALEATVGVQRLQATMSRGLHAVARVALSHYQAVDNLVRGRDRLWVAAQTITEPDLRAWIVRAAERDATGQVVNSYPWWVTGWQAGLHEVGAGSSVPNDARGVEPVGDRVCGGGLCAGSGHTDRTVVGCEFDAVGRIGHGPGGLPGIDRSRTIPGRIFSPG